MRQLLKDGQVIDNTWHRVEAELDAEQKTLPSGDILAPLSMWQNNQPTHEIGCTESTRWRVSKLE